MAAAAVVWLAVCDPETSPAPQCLFYRLTGWQCPGCGTQRAVHALLHGRFAAAWHYNAALLPALAVAALYALNPRPLRRYLWSTPALWVTAAAVIAWWIGRNLM